MNIETSDKTVHRLRSISGHVNSIERMVTEDQYCVDIIKQVQAVQAALSKVSTLVLYGHLHSCVAKAISGDEADERERILSEIVDVFKVAGGKHM